MNNKDIINLVVFIGICFIGYIFIIRINFKEGMVGRNKKSTDTTTTDTTTDTTTTDTTTTDTTTSSSMPSSATGIAGNASTYASNLKAASVKMGDTLLISKYRKDYEDSILNAEELISNIMLTTTLSLNPSNPHEGIKKLVALNEAKTALNSVMKYIDSV